MPIYLGQLPNANISVGDSVLALTLYCNVYHLPIHVIIENGKI